MELKQYNDGIQTASSGNMREQVFRSLSDFERSLANTMHRIEIVGKKGRHVAVLLTKQQKKRIDTLNRLRRQAGVDEENKYVFARFGDSLAPVRSSDVLRKYAQMCGASKPEFITSTLLRKHVATISQILSLKNNEMDALAKLLFVSCLLAHLSERLVSGLIIYQWAGIHMFVVHSQFHKFIQSHILC